MKNRIQMTMIALAMLAGYVTNAAAQTAVFAGTQVTTESAIADGGKYLLQSQASGTPYIVDAGTYYSLPNAGNSATTAAVYVFHRNSNGTWRLENIESGLNWGMPVYNQPLVPVTLPEAGEWSLNFSGGIAYPTAPDANDTVRSIDRSSQKLVAYTKGNSVAQRMKIFELGEQPLSVQPLAELTDRVLNVGEACADDLAVEQWYVMFDRGYTDGHPHGYLYEQVSSHTLYNTATAPAGMAPQAAQYLVRLSDAGEGRYYVQTGYGNYFGAFTKSVAVPLTATPQEAITVAKIAGTDGHFYLQAASTGIVLDANDLSQGDATVVGWGETAPTATGGNNDWAFYPVTLEELSPDIALLDDDVTVTRGYQTTGRGNRDALLLRIDIAPRCDMADFTLHVALPAAAQAAISELYLYETSATEFIANIPAAPLATTTDIQASSTLSVASVTEGTHHYWLCATIREDAPLGTILSPALTALTYTTGQAMQLELAAKGNPERQGMKVFAQQNFLCSPTSGSCRYYRIPAMILDQNGDLVVAYDKRYNSNSDLGNHKIDVYSMRSEDGGRTWSKPVSVAIGDGSSAESYGFGDAALARAQNGTLVCIMAAGNKMWGSDNTNGMKYAGVARSTNNGKSWTLTKNFFATSRFYDEVSQKRASLGFANLFTTSGKGLTTTDGVIMFTTNCKAVGGGNALCYILYSTDNGTSWRLSNALAYDGCDESKLEQLNDGSLLLSVRQSGNRGWNRGTYTKNDDGTVTFNWGTQYRTADIWGNACNADILYYSRASATEPDILLHCYINTSGRQSLQLSMSIDGGTTWKGVYNIQPNGSCYSTMQVLPSGDVALFFEDESYSAGNGYALNFVTLTREQILGWFQQIGGKLPDGVESLAPDRSLKGEGEWNGTFNLAGQQLSKPQRGVNIIDGRKVVVK